MCGVLWKRAVHACDVMRTDSVMSSFFSFRHTFHSSFSVFLSTSSSSWRLKIPLIWQWPLKIRLFSQLVIPSLLYSFYCLSRLSLSLTTVSFLLWSCHIDVPNPQLSSSLSSTKSITHKKDLMEALRKTNPAGVTTAPVIFWDVEGALKTVSCLFELFPYFQYRHY